MKSFKGNKNMIKSSEKSVDDRIHKIENMLHLEKKAKVRLSLQIEEINKLLKGIELGRERKATIS